MYRPQNLRIPGPTFVPQAVLSASARPLIGSMNTETAASPSEYTIWLTGRASPSRRVTSITLRKPGSSALTDQPARPRLAGVTAASSRRQFCVPLRTLTLSRGTLPIASCTKENCSMVSPLRSKVRALSSMPVLTSDQSL